MSHSIFRIGAIVAALMLTAPAFAQDAAQPQRPTDVKSFDDWSVRCFPGALPPCEMLQMAQNKAGRVVMSAAIAYLPRQNRYLIQITTPLGVLFSKGIKIAASGYTSQAMPYLRCDNRGCYVEGFIDTGALDALGHSTAQAKLIVASLGGRNIALPLSLRGFSDAKSAMESLAREKTPAATPPVDHH